MASFAHNLHADKDASFFVGDAAGRVGDFAGTDRKWAINVGIPFFTPEVMPRRFLILS
jgi:bifunctional polynucleotide phosphatase/kinase